MNPVTIRLYPDMFTPAERILCRHEEMTVSGFRYATGVAGLRLTNDRGEVVILPYQGQQIWRCSFDGKPLAMRSVFNEPEQTTDYLGTYGGFLLHCGITGMGVPGPADTHRLHGELPNAPYDRAWVEMGADEAGPYTVVAGSYEHRVAFNTHYRAEPRLLLRGESSLIDASMHVTNLRATGMELMYMMHINFLPIDNAELVYSAHADPERVRVFNSVPSHIRESEHAEELKAYLERLVHEPSEHHVLNPDLPYDPEVVFSIDYETDEAGWAHSMMVSPEGPAAYVSHRPSELPIGIRWIARTGDEDAVGLVLPATAEHKGYTAEKEKGHVAVLGAGERRTFHVRLGLLAGDRVPEMRDAIASIVDGR